MRPSKRDELVRKALTVFYRDGFHATGMDTLVLETGISKTTMFKHFRTKEELILAVLRLRDENFRNWLMRRIADLSPSPAGQLIAVFDALGEWFAEPDFRGCMFIKAAGEYPEAGHPIHAQSAEHKRLLKKDLEAMARAAGATDPGLLARQLLILKEGAIVAAHMGFDPDPSQAAKSAAQALLAQALGAGAAG
ncbi:TetR/AcrR family transcriptional regulator [Roseibium suaedae]|uniref:Transcriptional regulator, TetR family n=1 Tax=Roseibium suaedae TaxID=735517 RepID=A0A1M7CRM0_9HYPH|nr:TetR family transcriptional regulator [Roseibium suaedae]SHL69820.1 transcriptional regulator, TetR family [Roseibium suaedae]